MTASKTWAYVSESGSKRITAWAIRQERAKYDGKPLGKTYWSNHKPGQRKPVKQVQTAGATFFAYISAADAAGGGGESLSHRLLKEAIAGLSGTRLKLGLYGEHDITITHGEMEKAIATAEGAYYADVYLRFSSTSSLELKWSGEAYIEVHHTHAVPADKLRELRQLRIPVVEVPLPAALSYPYSDEDTSDPRERAHVNWIRNMLQKGFLAGRVISDRQSGEFLEREVSRLENELRDAREGWDAAKRVSTETQNQLRVAEARAVELANANADSIQRMVALANDAEKIHQELEPEKARSRALQSELRKAQAIIAEQGKRIRLRDWMVIISLGAFLGLGALIGYQQFFSERPTASAFPTDSAGSVPLGAQSTPLPAKHAKREAAPKHRRESKQTSRATDPSEMESSSR